MLILLTACGSSDGDSALDRSVAPSTTVVDDLPTTTKDPADCTEPDQDVLDEPDWRQFAEYRDWTRDGCLVRIDYLADRAGAADCDFESVRVLITGDPIGTPAETATESVTYLRDPENATGQRAAFEPDTTLPESATDSGYRSGVEELWIDADDDTGVYIVTPDRTERWPRGPEEICG